METTQQQKDKATKEYFVLSEKLSNLISNNVDEFDLKGTSMFLRRYEPKEGCSEDILGQYNTLLSEIAKVKKISERQEPSLYDWKRIESYPYPITEEALLLDVNEIPFNGITYTKLGILPQVVRPKQSKMYVTFCEYKNKVHVKMNNEPSYGFYKSATTAEVNSIADIVDFINARFS
jgi:hypothetical protein